MKLAPKKLNKGFHGQVDNWFEFKIFHLYLPLCKGNNFDVKVPQEYLKFTFNCLQFFQTAQSRM